MAIGRTNAGGAGGAALNFKIIANTSLPNSAEDNTIWIDTNTPITDWIFSMTQPGAVDGRVWIATGDPSVAEINALKKNGIQVYLISAKQCISGTWVDKASKIYQNGNWIELFVWDGQLYESGNEFISDTGGLEFSVGRTSAYSAGIGTKGSETIILECNVQGTAIEAVTANKIDLTNYSTLKCNITSFKKWGRFVIASTKEHDGAGVAFNDLSGTGVNSMDVSGLNGSYYICVYTHFAYDGSETHVEFEKLWLE